MKNNFDLDIICTNGCEIEFFRPDWQINIAIDQLQYHRGATRQNAWLQRYNGLLLRCHGCWRTYGTYALLLCKGIQWILVAAMCGTVSE